MMKRVVFLSIAFLALACKDYTPKPKGYNRIDFKDSSYKIYHDEHFSFNYSDLAYIDFVSTNNNAADNKNWFNIIYPDYNLRIYCTFLPINKISLKKMLDDSYYMAHAHVLMADGINQTLYSNPEKKVSGIVYDIEGSVATPIQFFLTDSISNFFRASFYYDVPVKYDSVAPVTNFIRNDIMELIESFEWK